MTAAEVWDQVDGQLGDRIGRDLRDFVRRYEAAAERSRQTDIGPSEIGRPCTRCLARHVLGVPVEREHDDPWCRIIGTATHAWLDEAAQYANVETDEPRWVAEGRVYPDTDLLPSGGRCDLYDANTRTVIDHKVVGAPRLRAYRVGGPGEQYRRQAHLYGKGYVAAGRQVDNVAVAFWMRGGRLRDLYVWTEPYDVRVADEALHRYRTIRDQAQAIGPAILPHLPADPDCFDCGGEPMTTETGDATHDQALPGLGEQGNT